MFTVDDIQQFEMRIRHMVRKCSNAPISLALKDTCSEVSRLVGLWILEKDPTCSVLIYKGQGILHIEQAHDVLFVTSDGSGQGMIMDPTVYQFFPEAECMRVDTCNKKELLLVLSARYGGEWQFSETLRPDSYLEKELEEVLIKSLCE